LEEIEVSLGDDGRPCEVTGAIRVVAGCRRKNPTDDSRVVKA
jgi:hypothetical protein